MTVTDTEPEYDELDRGWVEALLDLQADEHTCGGRLSETTDNKIVWTAEPAGFCNRCYALAYKQHLQVHAKHPEAPSTREREEAEKDAANAARMWRSDPVHIQPQPRTTDP